MNKQHQVIYLAGIEQAYRLFENPNAEQDRTIVLLHGAGVAGQLTWNYVAHYLKHWRTVIIPDLVGCGDSYFLSESVPDAKALREEKSASVEQVSDSIKVLLLELKVKEFDLVGYSLGGLIALLLNQRSQSFKINTLSLIEPALFSSVDSLQANQFRQSYRPVADQIIASPNDSQPFLDFLNLVSPKRKINEKVDQIALQRLMQRPLGFAYSLQAVTDFIAQKPRMRDELIMQLEKKVSRGMGIVGQLSPRGLFEAQLSIAQQVSDWQVHSIPQADHGLVYNKPKRVAALLNSLYE